MPSVEQKVPIPFVGGVDTKTDEKAVLPTKLTLLENGKFVKHGSIVKREGYDSLEVRVAGSGSSSDIDNTDGLIIREDELLLADSNNDVDSPVLWSYSKNNDEWVSRGWFKPVIVNSEPVAQTPKNQSLICYAEDNGVAAYGWYENSSTINFAVVDVDTGMRYSNSLSDAGITTETHPRMIAINGYIFFFFVDTANETLKCYVINTYDPVGSSVAISNVVNDIRGTNVGYDVCVFGTRIGLAYVTNANTVKIGFVDGTGHIVGPPDVPLPYELPYDAPTGVLGIASGSFVMFTTGVGVCIGDTTGGSIRYIGLSVGTGPASWTLDNDSTSGSATNIANIAGIDNDVGYEFALEYSAASASNHYVTVVGYNATAYTKTTRHTTRHCGLAGKPFVPYGTNVHVPIVHESSLQSTYFVVDQNQNTVAKMLPGTAAGVISEAPLVPEVIEISDGIWAFPTAYKTRLDATDATNTSSRSPVYTEEGIKRVTLDFGHQDLYSFAEIGKCTYLTGGQLFKYDGQSVVESGFNLYPELSSSDFTTSNGAGSLTNSADYWYRIYWEWVNAKGEREQSSCNGIHGVTLGAADDTVDITVPSLPFTLKTSTGSPGREECYLAVYRTEANPTASSLFYRVSSLDPTDSTRVVNNPALDTVAYTDLLADSAITSNELDYQNSGELDNIAPQAPSVIARAKDRLFIAGGDMESSDVYYSKLHTWVNAAEFNDGSFIKLDKAGGEVTGLAILNDNLIAFKKSRVFVVPGDGPDNLGFGSFGEPQQIATDVGCKNQKSIVLMPEGLMFQSEKGIYLLGQDLRLSYIGADVETYNSQTITAATMLPDTNQILFLTSSGSTLMYDYHFKQWSTYTNHEGVGAAIWDDTYCYVTSSGIVMKQDSSYLDGSTPYKLRAQTAWIKFGGMQNFANVKSAHVLGEFHTDHTIRMKIGYDYEPVFRHKKEFDTSAVLDTVYWGDSATWGADDYWGGSGDTVYQFRAFMPRQKCEAIRFLFEDIPGDTPGQGYEITELSLLIELEQPPWNLRAGKTL